MKHLGVTDIIGVSAELLRKDWHGDLLKCWCRLGSLGSLTTSRPSQVTYLCHPHENFGFYQTGFKIVSHFKETPAHSISQPHVKILLHEISFQCVLWSTWVWLTSLLIHLLHNYCDCLSWNSLRWVKGLKGETVGWRRGYVISALIFSGFRKITKSN